MRAPDRDRRSRAAATRERAAELLAPFTHEAVDTAVRERVLPALLG